MARPLRIEYPGALYHVTARGNAGQPIFLKSADKEQFLKILSLVLSRYEWRCYAFCLMDNHYHLVVKTKKANLSRGMRQLNGIWAQQQNNKLKKRGHLFQGRFKAFLIEEDSYLLAVLSYAVLTPVRAGICASPEEYRYSSFLKTACLAGSKSVNDCKWVQANELMQYVDEARIQEIALGCNLKSYHTFQDVGANA